MLFSARQLLFCFIIAIGIATTSFCRADTIPLATTQQDQARTDIIDDAAIQQDLRLQRPVSLSARRLPLKMVLNQFSAQTGVALTMDERDPGVGPQRPGAVVVSGQPVGLSAGVVAPAFSGSRHCGPAEVVARAFLRLGGVEKASGTAAEDWLRSACRADLSAGLPSSGRPDGR